MTDRSRSYSWQDPRPVWQSIGVMSGLEFLRREIRGEAPPPPICISMRYELTAADAGHVVYTGVPGEDHYNAVGGVQGGWITGLLDAAIGSAVFSTLPAGARYTTLELKINFVRPVTVETGKLRCVGQAIHEGRRVGTAEGRVYDASDKLYAHASTTCMIFADAS
jgi:uncharacterized protein (TIGR00369 family)